VRRWLTAVLDNAGAVERLASQLNGSTLALLFAVDNAARMLPIAVDADGKTMDALALAFTTKQYPRD
jgi:hypothetical protein